MLLQKMVAEWRLLLPPPPRPNVYGPVKAPFLTKKTSAVKSETGFSREATEN